MPVPGPAAEEDFAQYADEPTRTRCPACVPAPQPARDGNSRPAPAVLPLETATLHAGWRDTTPATDPECHAPFRSSSRRAHQRRHHPRTPGLLHRRRGRGVLRSDPYGVAGQDPLGHLPGNVDWRADPRHHFREAGPWRDQHPGPDRLARHTRDRPQGPARRLLRGDDRRLARHPDPEPRRRRQPLRRPWRCRPRRGRQLPRHGPPPLRRRPLRELPALDEGDSVFVTSGGTVYEYEITESRTTSFRSDRSLAEQRAAVPGFPGERPTQAMITISTCATLEDNAAGNYWRDDRGNPEHRIDKIGVLTSTSTSTSTTKPPL